MSLSARLHEVARHAGAVGSGVSEPDAFTDVRATLEERDRTGLRGGLGFTYQRPEVSTAPLATHGWARSLFTVATTYLPEAGDAEPVPGTGRIARFATEDHYRPLVAVLDAVAATLRREGHRAVTLHDDNRLVDRAAAVRGGVGWWGASTMVLTPGYGPWTLLGTVVTDAVLEPTGSMKRTCGTCTACLPACPTGALVAPGVLDARLCLARILQGTGVIPRELRPAVEDRIYGCDDCLTACPPGLRLLSKAGEDRGRVDLLELLGLDDHALLSRFGHFYVPGRHPRFLRRNALVAIGNWGSAEAIVTLAAYAGHPDPMLRAHAAWALGRIPARPAAAVLAAALEAERDAEVVEELSIALARHAPSRSAYDGTLPTVPDTQSDSQQADP